MLWIGPAFKFRYKRQNAWRMLVDASTSELASLPLCIVFFHYLLPLLYNKNYTGIVSITVVCVVRFVIVVCSCMMCFFLITSALYIQVIHKRILRLQKWTRNLFLTLHRHNAHRQQQQLSKFLMRYQQFASHAYCGAAEPVSKMASQQEKVFCVLRFDVSRTVITVHETHAAL